MQAPSPLSSSQGATEEALGRLCRQVEEVAISIVQHSKHLSELVKETGSQEELEKAVIQTAKAAAKDTATLVDLINSAPNSSVQAKRLQLNILKNAGRECSTAVLALIGSTKNAINNPFDFMTKQDVTNKCKEVAISTQAVLETIRNLSSLCSPSMINRENLSETLRRENDKLLRDISRTVDEALISIGNLVEAVTKGNKAAFVNEAKASATKLAQLIETAKSLGIERDGAKLKQASLKIISTGKIALRTPQDSLYKQQLHGARQLVEECLRLCAMAIQSRLLAATKSTMETGILSEGPPSARGGPPGMLGSPPSVPGIALPSRRRTDYSFLAGPPSPGSQRNPSSQAHLAQRPPNWEGINKRYSLPPGQIQQALATMAQKRNEAWEGPKVADQVVRSLEERYPEIKSHRTELITTISNELSDEPATEGDARGKQASGQSGAGPEFEPRSELEKIIAMENYMEWRKVTMTRRQANKAKSILDDLRADNCEKDLAEDDGSGSTTLDPKKTGQQFKAISVNLGDAALELIVTANEHILNPRGATESLEDASRMLYLILKKILLIAFAAGRLAKVNNATIKIIEAGVKSIAESRTRGILEEDCAEAASTLAATMVETNLQKRVYFESNAMRVLTLQLLSATSVIAANTKVPGFFLTLTATARGLADAAAKLLDLVETSIYLSLNKNRYSMVVNSDIPMLDDAEEEAPDTNMWDDPPESQTTGIRYDETKNIVAASLNRLIEALTSVENYDSNFLHTFITTYQSFTTPYKLFEKLLQRYHVPKERVEEKMREAIRLRVSVVLKYWVSTQFSDLDEDMIAKVYNFVDNTLKNDGYEELAAMLKKEITTKIETRRNERSSKFSPPTELSWPDGRSISELFMVVTPQELAEQLTLIDFAIYSHIEPSELLNQSWNSTKLAYRAPNVRAMINRANSVSFWVASMILLQDKAKDRKKFTEKFIQISECLRKMNNFNTLMGIIAGLNMASINRLKAIKTDMSKKLLTSFQKLETLMHPQSSFKNYRESLHEASPPCIPYLGVYLTDLVFIEDGNPDESEGLVNFYKVDPTFLLVPPGSNADMTSLNLQRQLVYRVIQEVKQYQQTKYTFVAKEPLTTFLTALPGLGDKQLYDLSLEHEPREKKKN